MQFVSLFVFPRSCAIKRNLITNSFAGSTSPVTIQPGSADSFQRFSGISAARRLINEGQEIRLLYWAWPKSSQDRAVCLAKDGEGITDQAIAAVLVIEDLVKQGLTDKKMNDLYNLGIAHHTVAHMFRKKLTNQEIVALLNKALKDNATANKLMNPDTLTSEELRNLLKPAANSASVDKKLAKPTQAKESIEVSSSPKASSSGSTNNTIQAKDPTDLPQYHRQVDGEDARALPKNELAAIPLEDRIAYARFEFDRKNKLIRDLIRRKGKDKIAAYRWDVPLDKIKQA